ncbi:hypothetical protein [Sphingobacterium bambusae]|uniref:Lipid/polyisoprenoid-binding YceI-like domain-containing protein n=1 Tax=Sphingobacterium bambusae TaxID=662858 RepID=A0ABW6BMH2_9SPHI|nr:hypothetical protein [Sphingobacterium bambusae]WPL47881.1 hypothetical protein SCB77_18185 [Sphingobacterium bambusae]
MKRKDNWRICTGASMLGCWFLLLLAGCSKGQTDEPAKDEGFNSRMKQQAYVGKTKSTLYLGGYDPLPSVEGTGSFNIDKIKGDSSTVALVVDFTTDEGFSFGIPGRQEGMSWQSIFPDASTLIKANGEIDAKIITTDKEISWDGHLFDDKLVLDINIKYLKAEGEIPIGSILRTRLDLLNPTASSENTTGNGCKVIVWQSRAVFNVYAGGVDLIQVPVCH